MPASALPLIFILAAIAVLGVSGNLFSASPFIVAGQITAIGLNVWARRLFQKGMFRVTAAPIGRSIIRRGPYRFIRHPMYSAVLLFVWVAIPIESSITQHYFGTFKSCRVSGSKCGR